MAKNLFNWGAEIGLVIEKLIEERTSLALAENALRGATLINRRAANMVDGN